MVRTDHAGRVCPWRIILGVGPGQVNASRGNTYGDDKSDPLLFLACDAAWEQERQAYLRGAYTALRGQRNRQGE
jgi:hypothetical protein